MDVHNLNRGGGALTLLPVSDTREGSNFQDSEEEGPGSGRVDLTHYLIARTNFDNHSNPVSASPSPDESYMDCTSSDSMIS